VTTLSRAGSFGAVLVLYLISAVAIARTRVPWSNEAWAANPAATFAGRGYLGTPILASEGTWLRGIDRHTYWSMPLQPLLLGGWFLLFGVGLTQQLAFSIVCGAVSLAAAYAIGLALLRKYPHGEALAILPAALLTSHLPFLEAAANGRMEMLCLTFGLSAYAAHFWSSRPWVSHAFAAASIFVHPCGVLFAAGLVTLNLFENGPRPAWPAIFKSALPYILLSAGWAAYIAQAPADFRSQFLGNLSGFAGEYNGRTRVSGLSHPLQAMASELRLRYLEPLGFNGIRPSARSASFVFALALVLIAFVYRPLRSRSALLLPCLWILHAFILAIFEGMKFFNYLIFSSAILVAAGGVIVALWIGQRLVLWRILGYTVALLVLLGPFMTIRYAMRDTARPQYDRVAQFLETQPQGTEIAAPAEFAYRLGFEGRFRDDVRLGFLSHREPQVAVLGVWYRMWSQRSSERDPALAAYYRQLLTQRLKLVFRAGDYEVYARRQP
jgi:hypothetical protein